MRNIPHSKRLADRKHFVPRTAMKIYIKDSKYSSKCFFSEQIMSAGKYESIISRKIEASAHMS